MQPPCSSLNGPSRDKDTPNNHIDRKKMLENKFPDNMGCCSEDYRKGRLARNWQHNLAPREFPSPYPSMVLLSPPQEVGGFVLCFVWAWGHWGMIPTKKNTQKHKIVLFFYDFLGHLWVARLIFMDVHALH
jgi:hypothetical protein